LAGMWRALELSPYRDGNALRRRLLLDSRDEPWSAAERLCHRLLREAGITGWRANVAAPTLGHIYFIDVAFEHLMLGLEIDGRRHQNDQNLFEWDRWRQNALVLQGWRVLRFTWDMLTCHPDLVVQTIREALTLQLELRTVVRRRA
jgi:very-short-patch-repair endonuclease